MKVVITNNTKIKLQGIDLDDLIEIYSKWPKKVWYNAPVYSITHNDIKVAYVTGYMTPTSIVININPLK